MRTHPSHGMALSGLCSSLGEASKTGEGEGTAGACQGARGGRTRFCHPRTICTTRVHPTPTSSTGILKGWEGGRNVPETVFTHCLTTLIFRPRPPSPSQVSLQLPPSSVPVTAPSSPPCTPMSPQLPPFPTPNSPRHGHPPSQTPRSHSSHCLKLSPRSPHAATTPRHCHPPQSQPSSAPVPSSHCPQSHPPSQ